VRGLGTPSVQIHRADTTAAAASGAGAFGSADLLGVALLGLGAALLARTRAHRFPWCTLAVASAGLLVSFGPGASELSASLRLDRAAVLHGELWRLLSGHLVHGWPRLAVFDLGAIMILGTWIEQRSRADLTLAVVLAALLSSTAVLGLRPDLALYQGSSALAAALFVVCAAHLARSGQDGRGPALAATALLCLGAKLTLESSGLWPSPALAKVPGVESVAVAHAAGALAGALAIVAPGLWRNRGLLAALRIAEGQS
jgi:rhomboid family GlyGly-CTERM serine protease